MAFLNSPYALVLLRATLRRPIARLATPRCRHFASSSSSNSSGGHALTATSAFKRFAQTTATAANSSSSLTPVTTAAASGVATTSGKKQVTTLYALNEFLMHPLTWDRNNGYFNILLGLAIFGYCFCTACKTDAEQQRPIGYQGSGVGAHGGSNKKK